MLQEQICDEPSLDIPTYSSGLGKKNKPGKMKKSAPLLYSQEQPFYIQVFLT